VYAMLVGHRASEVKRRTAARTDLAPADRAGSRSGTQSKTSPAWAGQYVSIDYVGFVLARNLTQPRAAC
jgi:hypothetical protein